MKNNKQKCSSKLHTEIDAITFCQECRIYMCNKCEKHHIELFQNHHSNNLDKINNDIFTGFCKEKNHIDELNYFCKTHNKLCCAACIVKIKGEGNGQHTDCNICFLKEIKDEKKNKLKENMKCLEELSNNLESTINELKILFEKINENKEELKLKIQKIFTKIRNALNDREDELLLEVDKLFEKLYCNEDIIKESEKLPNKIKISLEKSKIIEKEWNDDKLNILINECINVEDNIKAINEINENIKKCKENKNKKIQISPQENEINEFSEKIKIFGKVYYNSFKFRKCPENINKNKKYIVTGENQNILTKISNTGWCGTICENELEKNKEHKWKIKILKTQNKYIMVGVASSDFDIKSASWDNCGWYFYYYNSQLYSGPPYNYSDFKTNLSKVGDEVIIIINMNKRTLKFIINNEDKGDSYTNIPIDKPLFPAVLLANSNDSVQIEEC